MQFLFLMVILTVLDNGKMSVAFVNTEDLASCQDRAEAVRGILSRGKVNITSIDCFSSKQKFEVFAHGKPAKGPRSEYLIHLAPKSVKVEAMANSEGCKVALDKQSAGLFGDMKLYCASSQQAMAK